MNHVLKTHAEPFANVWAGDKLFEIRADDREPRFAVGDRLYLVEWDPATNRELDRWIATRILCIVRGPAYGLLEDYCVLGLDPHITCSLANWSGSETARRLGEQSRTPGREVA